jgi:putative transposase
MLSIQEFRFFDPTADLSITIGDLPHWEQPGATYFVTFRTHDSIPPAAMNHILQARNDWLNRHGINPSDPDSKSQILLLSRKEQMTFRRFIAGKFERALDHLEGDFLLKTPCNAQLVGNSLMHFDSVRYRIAAYVVMPNHVHVLVCMDRAYSMLQQVYGWKHYQAYRINMRMNRCGSLFQKESFDHLVRDEMHLKKFRKYIAENPVKAKLRSDEYLLYLPDIEGLSP